jgi:hypothetical protein
MCAVKKFICFNIKCHSKKQILVYVNEPRRCHVLRILVPVSVVTVGLKRQEHNDVARSGWFRPWECTNNNDILS